MKKLASLIMILTVVMSSFGCSKQPTSQNNSEPNSIINENTESTPNNVEIQNTKYITFSTNYEIIECYMGYFIATTNDGRLYGVLDSKGNTVIDFIYDSLTFGSNETNRRENVIYASTEDGKGIIDFKGNIIIPMEYDEIQQYEKFCDYTFASKSNNIYLLSKNHESTIIDITAPGGLRGFRALGNNYFVVVTGVVDRVIYNLKAEKIHSFENKPVLYDRVSEKYVCFSEFYLENNKEYSITTIFDNDYNLCCKINEIYLRGDLISYVSEETGIIELENGEKALIEYATGNITKDFDPNIINDKTISVKSKSDTYRVYDSNGNDLFNERFYNAKEFNNEYVLLENLDGQEALINMYGEVMYDFGTISENTIFEYVKEEEFFNKDMYCAIVNNGNNYTVYAYIN